MFESLRNHFGHQLSSHPAGAHRFAEKWIIWSAQRRAIQVLAFVVVALAALAALSVLSALGWMSS